MYGGGMNKSPPPKLTAVWAHFEAEKVTGKNRLGESWWEKNQEQWDEKRWEPLKTINYLERDGEGGCMN